MVAYNKVVPLTESIPQKYQYRNIYYCMFNDTTMLGTTLKQNDTIQRRGCIQNSTTETLTQNGITQASLNTDWDSTIETSLHKGSNHKDAIK